MPFVITAVAFLGVTCGVWRTSRGDSVRRLVPFSGGLLMGVALFWVLPEMAQFLNLFNAVAWIGGGFAVLWAIDRFLYPVCPACSTPHEHDHCAATLHGFAPPLLIAAALHSVLDGWSVAAANNAGPLVVAIGSHKIPEGLALGVIVRAALNSRRAALAWCLLAESATLAGAALAMVLAPVLGPRVVPALLAVAGGTFLYLGGHAVHGEFRRRGLEPAAFPATIGFALTILFRFF